MASGNCESWFRKMLKQLQQLLAKSNQGRDVWLIPLHWADKGHNCMNIGACFFFWGYFLCCLSLRSSQKKRLCVLVDKNSSRAKEILHESVYSQSRKSMPLRLRNLGPSSASIYPLSLSNEFAELLPELQKVERRPLLTRAGWMHLIFHQCPWNWQHTKERKEK